MDTGYLGGISRPTHRLDDSSALWSHPSEGWKTWHHGELFVSTAGRCCSLYSWGALALVIRGSVRSRCAQGPGVLDRVAQEIRCHYLEHGDLPVTALEGSFTLALLDSEARRLLLYRNLVGAGFTYYH